MKLFDKGGKIINRGYKGVVMELYNKNENDNKTLYQELLEQNTKEIKLITINKEIKVPENKKDFILNLIKNNEQKTLAKKFVFKNILFGSSKKNFNNELEGYKKLIKIFNKDISKYTTIKKGFTYNNQDIYAIIFNNNYYVFLEKCFKTLDNIEFDEKLLNKCIKDILEILNILFKNNYIHNDIKPDNIIMCKNRFKLIDWESSNYIKEQANTFINTKNGNLVFNHPIKFYRIGVPYVIYKYIYDIELISYKYLYHKKTPQYISNEIEKTFSNVVEKYKENKNFYLKLADYFSFATTIIYMAEKNKITDFNKKPIETILSKFFIKMI